MPTMIDRSFTSGEIAPALRSRADLVKYITGLARCENFIVRPQGGVYSRPGTRYVGEICDCNNKARLIPFSFSTEQTYVLLFENNKLRVVKNGGFILDGSTNDIYELVTPYTTAQLDRLYYVQDADVLTIVHPDHNPKVLKRLAEDNWVIEDISFAPTVTPPQFINDVNYAISGASGGTPVTINVSSTAGLFGGDAITISGVTQTCNFTDSEGYSSCSGGSWATYLNGKTWVITEVTATSFKLVGSSFTTDYTLTGGNAKLGKLTTVGSGAGDYSKAYTYVVTAVDQDGVESLPSGSATITTKSLSTTAGVRLVWSKVSGAVYYRVYKDPSNRTDYYGWIGDSNSTSFDDFNIAPITSDSPPRDRRPFDGVNNKPSVVSYYQQRQIYANTISEPQTVFTTQTAIYNSMRASSPSRADDAITFTVKAQQVNEIRHIIALDAMIMLTSGGEWKVTEGQDQVLTPSNLGVRPQSFNGASYVRPAIINNTAVYIQEKGTRLRDLGYDFSSDTYTGNDLSLMAEHLFQEYEVVDMAFASEPYGVVWCVRNDGVMLGLTYQREHQVWGWHQHTTDGEFESIAVIGEGQRDALYVIVKRTINGVTKRYVERMEPRYVEDPTDGFYVDSGLTYNGAPVTTLSGLEHLEGKQVSVLADGYEVENLIVTAGSITLPIEASKVNVGLPYLPVIETLDVDIPSQQESFKSFEVSVSKVTIEMEKSRGGWVGPKKDDGSTGTMYEIKPRFESDGYNTIGLKDYKFEISIEPQWSKGGGIRIEQRAPLPLAILSITPMVDIGG